MNRKIRKFFQLSTGQKCYFLEAYWRLLLAVFSLNTMAFDRMVRRLERKVDRTAPEPGDQRLKTARIIGEQVVRAANNTPWRSACLAQAFVAQQMMEKRNIPGVFHIGVRLDQGLNKQEKLTAHAWLICGTSIITGGSDNSKYTILSTYGW